MANHIYAATKKGLFTIEKASAGWRVAQTAFLGDNTPMMAPLREDGLLVALDHGHFGSKMHRSMDGGKTWQETSAPQYPPRPDDADDVNPVTQTAVPWSLKLVWSLETGGADEPGVLWAGTVPGGLFKSEDNGDSWELVRPLWDNPSRKEWFGGGMELPGIHSICVDPRDSRRVALGVSCGGVWLTEDGGQSWSNHATGMRAEFMPPEHQYNPNIQDAHRLVQCAGQPDHYWAQHHNGIFRCADDLESWSEIEAAQPSSFGFAVAVHPRKADTAWFVPAIKDEFRYPVDGKVVVSRTTDGGRSFEVLRKGLPQEHAYDLTYRHGMDIDETGDTLAFGTTTGSLFVSEDGGDSWQAVSTHLPPIHCVRFEK